MATQGAPARRRASMARAAAAAFPSPETATLEASQRIAMPATPAPARIARTAWIMAGRPPWLRYHSSQASA